MLDHVFQIVGNSSQFFLDGRTVDGCELSPIWKPKEYYYFGTCYNFNVPDCVLSKAILELAMEVRANADIFLHHEDQFMSPNSRSRVNLVTSALPNKTQSLKLALSLEIVRLNPDTGKCTQYDSGDMSQYSTFDDCLYSKLYDVQMEQVGCTVPWLVKKDNICVDEAKRKHAFQ